jgi:uncharacterized protein
MNGIVKLDRRSMIQAGLAFLGMGAAVSCSHAGSTVAQASSNQSSNRDAVEAYFIALETGKFEALREIFAEDARQIMPYSFGDFPRSFDGREGIYNQYRSLPEMFSKMSFPRTIYPTENPNVLFVQFKGDIEIRNGGRYQNDYVGIFRFENGLIKEYTEYFNPILVSKAFNVPIS